MGEAKRRGTFEERKAAAIKRDADKMSNKSLTKTGEKPLRLVINDPMAAYFIMSEYGKYCCKLPR